MANLVYKNITDRVKSRVHNPNLSSADLSLWVNSARDRLIRTIKPSFLIGTQAFSAVVDQSVYRFPNIDPVAIDGIVNVTNNRVLEEVLESNLDSIDADRDSESGPYYYVVGDLEYIHTQPSAASKISLSSSVITDTSAEVLVKGMISNLEVTETVTLDAADSTTPVDTANTYDSLISISLPTVITGSLTATSNATTVTNVTIPSSYHYTPYTPVTLWGIPTATDTYRLRYYKTITQLSNDGDPLGIPDDWSSLLYNLTLVEAHRNGYEIEISELLLNHIEEDIFYFQSLYKATRRKHNSMVKDRSTRSPFSRFDHTVTLG